MISFKFKIWNLTLNRGQYQKALFDHVETQVRQGAREWLRAIILSQRIPIWAGTARGTLKPIGQFLRVAVSTGPPAATAIDRKGVGPDVGAGQSTFEFQRGYITEFSWSTSLLHFEINEFSDDAANYIHLKNPVPWHALQIGREAYKTYMKQNLTKGMPRISAFLKRSNITSTLYK